MPIVWVFLVAGFWFFLLKREEIQEGTVYEEVSTPTKRSDMEHLLSSTFFAISAFKCIYLGELRQIDYKIWQMPPIPFS